MRKKLQGHEGERKLFQATVEKFGKKMNYLGYSEETLLLKKIVDIETQAVVSDHIWFTYSKTFQQLALKEGTLIRFEARIKQYTKGYVNRRYKIDQRRADYKLSNPTKISVVNR